MLLLLSKEKLIPIVAVIAVVVILVLLVVVIILRRRSKKKNNVGQRTLDDRELVAQNSKAIEALVVLAGDNADLTAELKDLQEKLKYLIPTDNSHVTDYDKKIKNLIGDLRIALTKSDGEESKKAKDILTDIKLAVADRNTKL